MNIAEKNRIFLAKLRNLPEDRKKIILWTIVIVLGLTMGFFWVKGTMDSLAKINIAKEMPDVKIPQINMPDVPIQNLQNEGVQNNQKATSNTAAPINK